MLLELGSESLKNPDRRHKNVKNVLNIVRGPKYIISWDL